MEAETARTIPIGINGEYITQIVREQFFINGMDCGKVMEILLGCMGGTDMEEAELKRYAEEVLLGRAEFKGNTADNTFHMATYDAGEEPKLAASFRIFEQYSRTKQKLMETEKELDKMRECKRGRKDEKKHGSGSKAAAGCAESIPGDSNDTEP